MAKKLIAALIAAGLMLGLTGCEESLTPQELASQKDACEKLGGEFDQWKNGYGDWRADCIFDGGRGQQ